MLYNNNGVTVDSCESLLGTERTTQLSTPHYDDLRKIHVIRETKIGNTTDDCSEDDNSDSSSYSSSYSNSYSSSISHESERSEEYVPLTCTLVKTYPHRQCTHLLQEDIENEVSKHMLSSFDDDDGHDDKDSLYKIDEENESEVPVRATLLYFDVARQCGDVLQKKYASYTTDKSLNEPSSAELTLDADVSISRVDKHAENQRWNERFAITFKEDNSELSSTSEKSNSMEKNFDQITLIVNIVRRLHTNPEEVTLEMLELVNWGDENYQQVLEPLHRIYCYLESKAKELENVPAIIIRQKHREFAKNMSSLIEQLPSAEAIHAQLFNVQSHQIQSNNVLNNHFLNAHEAADGTRKPEVNGKNNCQNEKLDVFGTQQSNALSRRKGDSCVLECEKSSHLVNAAASREEVINTKYKKLEEKEAICHEDEYSNRRQRNENKHSRIRTSFNEIPMLEQGDEIVEPECELVNALTNATKRDTRSELWQNIVKAKRTHRRENTKTRKHRKQVQLLFAEAPENENVDAVVEENTDFINNNNNNNNDVDDDDDNNDGDAKKVKISCNDTSLRHESVQKRAANVVLPNSILTCASSATSKAKTDGKSESKELRKHSAKHRRERLNKSIRSCDFAELEIEEPGEMPDVDQSLHTNHESELLERQATMHTNNIKTPYCRDFQRIRTEINEAKPPIALAATKKVNNDKTCQKGKKSKKLRKTLHRSRDISISQLEDVKVGEIFENESEVSINSLTMPLVSKEQSVSRLDNMFENVSTFTNRKNVTHPHSHSSLHSVSITLHSDVNNPSQEVCSFNNSCNKSTSKSKHRRHRRLHISRELSITQVSDEVAGEILENNTETLNLSDTITSSTQSQTRNRVLPKHVMRIERVCNVENQIMNDITSPHLPAIVQKSREQSKVATENQCIKG